MDDIKQKTYDRFNFKPWKNPSNGIKKQELWHAYPQNLEDCSRVINGVISEKPP